jgi:hypothetical protein
MQGNCAREWKKQVAVAVAVAVAVEVKAAVVMTVRLGMGMGMGMGLGLGLGMGLGLGLGLGLRLRSERVQLACVCIRKGFLMRMLMYIDMRMLMRVIMRMHVNMYAHMHRDVWAPGEHIARVSALLGPGDGRRGACERSICMRGYVRVYAGTCAYMKVYEGVCGTCPGDERASATMCHVHVHFPARGDAWDVCAYVLACALSEWCIRACA